MEFEKLLMALEGGMVCPRGLSFLQFVVLMSNTNCEKDSLLGQTVLPPEPLTFFQIPGFFYTPFNNQ